MFIRLRFILVDEGPTSATRRGSPITIISPSIIWLENIWKKFKGNIDR